MTQSFRLSAACLGMLLSTTAMAEELWQCTQCQPMTPPLPINDPPVAVDDLAEGTAPFTAKGNVLDNDSDPDGDPLTVAPPNDAINADGGYSITFDMAGEGEFHFPYTVVDNKGGSASATLRVIVAEPPPPINEPPVAVDDTDEGLFGGTIEGNVLANDSDPEGDTLSVVQPNLITATGDYSLSGLPVGTHVIPYTVSDAGGATDEGQLTVTVTEAPPTPTEVLAFPGADGFGRFAKGGRGGQVMLVTTRADTGPGSLRACVESSGPRTCIFRVSGYIDTGTTTIDVFNPYLTIAGESAPEKGVALRNNGQTRLQPVFRLNTHDVIIRHMKFRAGDPPHNDAGSPNGDSFAIGQLNNGPVYNIMIDHSSFSWGTDETFDFSFLGEMNNQPSPVDRVTLQESLVYEGLRPHSKGPNFRSCGISMIRSLIASNTIRNPNVPCGQMNEGGTRAGGGITGDVEFRNNVVYNGGEGFYDMWSGRGEGWNNIVGNVFIKGPNSLAKLNSVPHNMYPVDAWGSGSNRMVPSGTCEQNNNAPNCSPNADPLHVYLDDNIKIDAGSRVWPTDGITDGGVLNPNDVHLVSQTPVGDGHGEDGILGPVMPAAEVEAYVLANAGAFPKNRDAADADIVNDVTTRTGAIPVCSTGQTQAICNPSPFPLLPSGTPYPDTDHDGMDDDWESANGVSDPNGDKDGDGWTDLEEFLQELAATR